ncbi:S-layer homology domain-containing protein [Paenibacillus aestuarii]|uniref:S-layer homology domain-containing protein n=1 Tax=Paenibacillus aestuarii TaxID=516965 RepID=A0ABW0K8F0_9BACL
MRLLTKAIAILILSISVPISAFAANVTSISLIPDQGYSDFTLNNYYGYNIPPDIPLKYITQQYSDDGTRSSVTQSAIYSSSDPTVASINANGIVTGNKLGSTVITATYGGKSATMTITVTPPEGIGFNQSSYTFGTGATIPFTLSAHYTWNDVDIRNKATITSSDPSVANVTSQGIVGYKTGTTTLTASYAGLTRTASVTITGGDPYSGKDIAGINAAKAAGISYVNGIRQAMGMSALNDNLLLDKAAQAHSNYLQQFSTAELMSQGRAMHTEDQSKSGFVGFGASDRAKFFGYTGSYVAEDISLGETGVGAMKGLMDAPYHRAIMIDPSLKDIGVGLNTSNVANTVVDFGAPDLDQTNSRINYYPYPNQQNVPFAWTAAEFPNPLTPFGKEGAYVGYPITITANPYAGILSFSSATITDSKGNSVDYYRSDSSNTPNGGIIILTPKNPLLPGETYTVNFSGRYSTSSISNKWAFTTTPAQVRNLNTDPVYVSLNQDSTYPYKVYAEMDDGSRVDVTSVAQFTSPNPEKVTLSSGLIKALAPTDPIDIQVTYGGKSTSITVKVLAATNPAPPIAGAPAVGGVPLNNPTNGTMNSTLPQQQNQGSPASTTVNFSDMKEHWAAETIHWAVEQNIVDGYEDGTFKPDQNVTEAEFITMLLRAYHTDFTKVEGLDTSWSGKQYKVAQQLNFPIKGLSDPNLRNQIIDRLQVAEIIAGADGVNFTGDAAIQYLLGKGFSSGKINATVEGYMGSDHLTRSEAIQFIRNLLNKNVKELHVRPTESSSQDLLPAL